MERSILAFVDQSNYRRIVLLPGHVRCFIHKMPLFFLTNSRYYLSERFFLFFSVLNVLILELKINERRLSHPFRLILPFNILFNIQICVENDAKFDVNENVYLEHLGFCSIEMTIFSI